jgi:hypothetical protein
LVNQYVQVLSKTLKGSDMELTDQDATYANQLAGQLIDKVQIKEFDTWIGLWDAKLYQVHLVANAPSFISLVKNESSMNFGDSNDAKRLADVRQMASGFELYYNDHNGYPDGLSGKPLDMVPTYLDQVPVAPEAGGNCTDYFNNYWYTPTGTKSVYKGKTVYSSYTLTFCLGSDTGGYKAGIAKLSPSGIQDNITCPSSNQANCSKNGSGSDPNAGVEKQVTEFINKLDFSAQVSADVNYTDYGKTQTLTAPTGAFDVLQVLNEARSKSRDAKRIADVRQLASAMELYFNDFNSYPSDLPALVPKYIGMLPVAPTPADGTCSSAQNTYTYKFVSADSYQLTFCLGQTTGGYPAGIHTLSQSGIQ